MSTLNPQILAVPGDNFACGIYRIINPTILLQQTGLDITLAPAGKFRFTNYDVLYTQRIVSESSLKSLKNVKDRTGIKIIVDFDDLTWTYNGQGLPEYNIVRTKVNTDANKLAMDTYAKDVIDFATCTTESLKEALSVYIDPSKIKIIPNRLPVNEWLFDTATTMPAEDIFFYAGSATHYDNINKLPGDFSNGWIKYLQNKKVAVMGESPYFLKPVAKFNACPMQVYARNFHNYARNCKFIIAPLAENFFNKCKSNLKYLESCAVGRVCLVTDFPGSPYSDAHEYQKVPVNATAQTIEYIVERAKKHYGEILKYQYDYVKNYWLNNHINEYKDVLK